MTIVYVDTEQFPEKLGKFPDYITKGLKYPGGGKIRAGIQAGYGAYRYGRVYARKAWYLKKKQIYYAAHTGIGIGGGLIALSQATNKNRQTRSYLVKPSARCKFCTNYRTCYRCFTKRKKSKSRSRSRF